MNVVIIKQRNRKETLGVVEKPDNVTALDALKGWLHHQGIDPDKHHNFSADFAPVSPFRPLPLTK